MKLSITPLALALIVAGCASTPATTTPNLGDAQIQRVRSDVQAQRAEVKPFAFVNEVWLGAATMPRAIAEAASPELTRFVRLERSWGMTLEQVAEFITTDTGIPVIVMPDAAEASGAVRRAAPQLPPADMGAAMGLPMPPLPNMPAGLPAAPSAPAPAPTSAVAAPQGAGQGMVLSYSGDLRGLLNQVASRSNTSWRHRAGRIEFFHTDTRVFEIEVLPGAMTMQGSITNQSQGGSQGQGGATQGGSTQMQGGTQTSSNLELDQLKAVETAIKDMLTAKGKVTVTPGMGQVVVTDTPATLSRVEGYIEGVNAIAKRQVVMDVQVYSVENRESNGYAVSWALSGKWADGSVGVTRVGGIDNATSIAGAILTANSPFAGTKLFLDALASQGKVKQITSVSAVTLSGRPVPVQVAEEISYQASSQVSLVPNVGQQITRTQAKATVGFSMALLPMLTAQKDVLLQVQMSLSSLRELRRLGTVEDGSYSEMPLTDSQQTMQSVRLQSGQTLILTGFEQESLRSDASGVGTPGFKLLGGSKKGEQKNTTLVILITPRLA